MTRSVRVKMEEEEDTASTKKSRRKRKPRRDLTPPSPSSKDASEEELDEEEEVEPKKKKRGRKKKIKDPPVAAKTETEFTDMDRMEQVIDHLISASGSAAFLERPNDSMYGMSDYYEMITKPMWLKEVKRKCEAEEYTSPTEVVADVRLMLENCYHYWGPVDTLSKRAVKLEQVFENKLATLPESLQQQCSLEITHLDLVRDETDDESGTRKSARKGGFNSKLMHWVCYGKGSERDRASGAKTKRAEREAVEKDLTIWENENLLLNNVQDKINSMWEFPVIGHFLQLVYDVLNIDQVSQLELERMLLMPHSSRTLATVMTSMLIPPLFRAKLEGGPPMPYSFWATRLNTKVASWYRAYHSKGDSTVEVFDSLGIEPHFWLVMGEENPLKDYQFHELPFLQRVWLLKGLCDFLLHNHKTIQDCINNLEMDELRDMNLGRDKEGYSYHYFPMFTEVRIYKMAKVPDTKWKNYEAGVEEAITMCAEEEDDEDQSQEPNLIGFSKGHLHKPPRSMQPSHSDFKLVCRSLEDVRCLVDQFCDAEPLLLQGQGENAALVASLQSIISELESRESKQELAVFQIRCKMRDEFIQFKNRSADYVDPGIAYWERKQKEEQKFEEKTDIGIPGTSADGFSNEEDKRERRARRESSLKIFSRDENGANDYESAEESPLDFDDNSEDEWFANKRDKEIKKKREKRGMSAKKLKRLAELADKMNQSIPSKDREKDKLNLNASNSGFQSSVNIKVGGVGDSVKIKDEPIDFDDLPANPIKASKAQPLKTKPKAKRKTKDALPNPDADMHITKKQVTVKQEVVDEIPPVSAPAISNTNHNVIKTLVLPANVKHEQSKTLHFIPDLSKVKRSNSPDADVVYISDSDEPPDFKPNPALLNQQINTSRLETINYSIPQQPMGSYILQGAAPNQGQFVPVNVAPGITPGGQIFTPQPQVYAVAQPATPTVAYQMPANPTELSTNFQQPIIRPNPAMQPTVVRLQATSARQPLNPSQKFLVIQPTANQTGPQSNVPTNPTVQSVNWFGGRGSTPTTTRQRAPTMMSPRGRGSPRSPLTPTRGGPRFAGRTPPGAVRGLGGVRTPTQPRTPSPMRGRGAPSPVRPSPPSVVRNLNFNRSPAKPTDLPSNKCPEIEGTLVVSLTDSGGFGYVVMLADGGKISLTTDQLAKIRSDNGGTLPKTCKVPLMNDGLND